MRTKLAEADWTDMFLDVADYSQLSYRKKTVTKGLLVGTEIGISKKGAQISSGVIAGEKIKLFFNQLVGEHQGERYIQDLPLPLAIVATDIGTGERVVLTKGSLTQAMRASMSVPGLMAPVEYEGHKLVDGGLVDNLPIGVARDLCQADRVIAVNVGSPLKPAEEIGSLLSVTGQMIGILTNQNVERSLSTLTGGDVYVYPELGDIKSTDFKHYAKAADIGRDAAEKQLASLQLLSVDLQAYANWKLQRQDTRAPIDIVDEITIAPLKRVNPQFVRRLIRQKPGTTINRPQLEEDLIRIYGYGYFDHVDYRISNNQGVRRLDIIPYENNRSADYTTFGFTINNEYRQGANINLRGAYRSTWINSYGGEFFAVVELGSDSYLEADFFQPLDEYHRYFIEPRYVKGHKQINIFIDNDKVAEYKLATTFSELTLGRNLSIWGQARAGLRRYHIEGDADINLLQLPEVDERYNGWIFETLFDQRNRLYFPSRGWRGELSYFKSSEQDYKKLSGELGVAYPLGDFVLAARSSYVASIDSELPVFDSAVLGGLLNMSGYATNQILADKALFMGVRAEKIVGRMPLGLSGDLRMGLSLESPKLNNAYTLTDVEDDWLNSAAIYWGGETPMGPVYVGYGFTFSGDYNFYFQIGPSSSIR
jgi:NTE family protein